ncbi:MAG: autotransporter outer membrane beta-barrel domain-containing protein [Desulfuromonadales bacterium]|nr:autotransporter outer membrane beta-barrel domain-containing protein [Desulfuromonadales bacterium]
MNRVFKTIWNETLCAWIPVSEITKVHGKGRKGKLVVAAILACLVCTSMTVLPVHAQVVADGAGVNQTASGTVTATGTFALYATNGGNITTSSPLNVTTTGDTAYGAFAYLDGQITLVGASNITTSGVNSHGLVAWDGSITSAGPLTVTTTGLNANGAWVTNGGTLTLDQADITVNGQSAYTLVTDPNGGTATVSNSTLTNNGSWPVIWANAGSTITLTNVNITATTAPGGANYNYGIRLWGYENWGVSPTPVVVNGTNVTVNTVDWGAVVQGGLATLDLQDSTIHSTGSGGVYVSDDNTVVNLNNTAVISDVREAAHVDTSGALNAVSSTFTGATNAIQVQGGDPANGTPGNTVNITGGTITAHGGDAINAANTVANITLSGPISISASSGNLLNVTSDSSLAGGGYPVASLVNLTTSGVTAIGNIVADADSTANINLTNGTIITGIEQNTNTTVDSSSAWIMNGNSDIHSLAIAGRAQFTLPVGDPTMLANYKTLTTQNYVGQGGTIVLNTYLGAAGSPSDELIINGGTATGKTLLQINNTGGVGAQTTGNGIQVVQALNGATTDSDAFALSSPVTAGAYNYNLYQGGISGSDPESWYLRNSGLTNLAKSVIAGSDMASSWIINDTLLQRMGELRTTDYDQAKHGLQSWVRGYGWQANVNTNNSQVNYKSTVYGFDAGTDRTWQFENSQLSTGVFAGMSMDKRQVGNNAGHDNIDTISGGIYGTWENQKGYYIDVVGKLGNLNTEINSNDTYYSKATYNILGILGSIELGRQIKSEKGWYIEPQIQGTYVHFTSANYTATDNIGGQTEINQRASDSYDIRAGVVAGKRITTETAGILQPYIKGMYGQTWTDGGDVNIGGSNINGNSAGNRYELGGGITWQVTGDKQFYAEYDYIKGPRMEVPWKVNAGYRVVW